MIHVVGDKDTGKKIEDPKVPEHLVISTDLGTGKVQVVVDGIDITYWIANAPVHVESLLGEQTVVSLKLTAPRVSQHYIDPR